MNNGDKAFDDIYFQVKGRICDLEIMSYNDGDIEITMNEGSERITMLLSFEDRNRLANWLKALDTKGE